MPKTVSVSEAKNKLSAVINWAIENQEEVIVASRSQPKAVILSYAQYEAFLILRQQSQRREALQQLEALAARVQARNSDLSAEDVEKLTAEITGETLQRMEQEGKVAFQSS